MEKKHSNWLGLLIVTASLLGFLVLVNCYVDPANLFHNVSTEIADSVIAGNSTYITSGNMNERLVKQRIIETMPDEIECIAVGPSVMFGISQNHVNTDSYYNLGVSGADFYDIMAQFGLMELQGKTPKRVIFCVDSYFFNKALYDTFTRNTTYKPYADYMLRVLDGETNPEVPKSDTKAESVERIKQMFSVSYFQSSVEYVQVKGSLNIPRWGVADETYSGSYYMPDGSMHYAESYENSTVEDVIKEVEGFDVNYYFTPYEHISEESMEAFEKLIVYLQAQGTQVDLFLCPVCPSLWDRLDETVNPILWDVEDFAQNMSEKYELNIIGSYNPYNLGIPDSSFYDTRHVRHEMLEEYFEFQ